MQLAYNWARLLYIVKLVKSVTTYVLHDMAFLESNIYKLLRTVKFILYLLQTPDMLTTPSHVVILRKTHVSLSHTGFGPSPC